MRTLHLHNSISVRQILFLWFVLCLLPGIVHAGNRCEYRCDNSLTVPLLIDQKTQVGVVKVNYDDQRLNIKYVANEGWLIEKTHLAVSDSFSGLPQDAYGNPQLDQFQFQTTHPTPVLVANHMLSAQQWPLGTELYIAAQADVVATKSGTHDEHGEHHNRRYSAKSWHDDEDRQSYDDEHEGSPVHSQFYKLARFVKRNSRTTRNTHSYSKDRHHQKISFFKRFGDRFSFFGEKSNGHNDRDYDKHNDDDRNYAGHDDDDRNYAGHDDDGRSRSHDEYESEHHYKRCDSDHKNNDRGSSTWAKGDAFPGTTEGYYFTFTLKSCKPVSESTIQFSDAVYSSSEDEQNAVVTVTRSGEVSEQATVIIRTSDGTAQAGIDYGAIDMQLQFAPGETSKDVLIPVIDDSDVEDLETINVQLFDAQEATLGDQDTSVVELADNDVAQLDQFYFDPPDYTFREGSGLATITVIRDGTLAGEASVDYLVVGGTATPNIDYTFMPGTLVFADGQATATISLTILEDRAVDPNETILIGIDNAVNGQIRQPATAAVITIDDNEGNN